MTRATLALVLFACACTPGEKRERLTLYCNAQIEWCELAVATFERETGIDVAMTRKSSGETLAQLMAERKNPRGDVWWGGTGDAHIQAAEAGLTEPHVSPQLPDLYEWARDPAGRGEHRTTGVYLGALGFGYNREWLEKRGLKAPRRWGELLEPAFKGEIQMANPNSSGTAYTTLATLVQLMGEDEAFRFLRRLHEQVNQYTMSGAAPIRAAARGETGIGIAFMHDAIPEQEAGFPLAFVLPEDGTGYEIGCVSVIRGARHLENARRWAEWSLTAPAQELGAKARGYQYPSNVHAQTPKQLPPLAQVKLIDFDHPRFGSKAMRAHLLERWEREVKSP